jgi:hypothetical protein
MAGITTYLSILTHVHGLNSHIKRNNWQTGSKRKTQQSVIYKKPTLQTEINITLGQKGRRRFSKLMSPENRQE